MRALTYRLDYPTHQHDTSLRTANDDPRLLSAPILDGIIEGIIERSS